MNMFEQLFRSAMKGLGPGDGEIESVQEVVEGEAHEREEELLAEGYSVAREDCYIVGVRFATSDLVKTERNNA